MPTPNPRTGRALHINAPAGGATAAFQRNQRAADPSAGPWTKWKGSRAGRFVKFAEKYLRLPRGDRAGQLVKLMRWQKDFAEEWFADRVTAGALGMGRGGAKSTTIAMFAAFDGFDSDSQGSPFVPVIAVSLGQARSAIYSQVAWMVQAEPELKDRSLTFAGMGTERILIPRTAGVIVPRAADADALQGMDIWPGAYLDEIGHSVQATWDAILLSRKRKGARVLGAGTWGPDTNSPLYQLRKMVREGLAPADFLWRIFSGRPGAAVTDESNWYAANPSLAYGMPDIDFLRNAAVMSPEAAFRTYHLNEPDVTGHDSWLGTDARAIWSHLESPWEFQGDDPLYVGVDVGLVRDCTAVVSVQERPDGRLHAKAKIWTPAPGMTVDIMDVMAYLRDLARTFDVRAISYDPRLFELPAKMLTEERLPMVEVPQSVEHMTPVVGALFELIRRAGLSHDGDENFMAHVVNAIPRLNERGFTLSKSKSAPRGHIDACIGLALAVDRYAHRAKRKAKVFVG